MRFAKPADDEPSATEPKEAPEIEMFAECYRPMG